MASSAQPTTTGAGVTAGEPGAADAFRDGAQAHPGLLEAVVADARVTAAYRGERSEFRSKLDTLWQVLRLMLVTDAFLGQAAYRLEVWLRGRGIPVLPWIAHRWAMMLAQIAISEAAVVQPGVFIANGQVVIQGMVAVRAGAILSPWITIGPIAPDIVGPTIGPRARIGTGAKVLGRITIGRDARVAANSVVLNDVPVEATVVGAPAKAASD